MSVYQFAACVAGWNASQRGADDGPSAPSDDEFNRFKELHGD